MNFHAIGDNHTIVHGDCLEVMREIPDDYFDLIVCSPPYEDCRTYGIDFNLKGQEYVDWAVERYLECVRICKGLVVWVIEGKTKHFRWSATPALLMADLHRRGVKLRKPPIFHRVGIPGSGGPDWWRNDYEFCIASSKGKLPWSDNTATGHPPVGPVGGEMSYRNADGRRKNRELRKAQTRRKANGERLRDGEYVQPEIANPGNVVWCHGGGGHLGSKLAHENEAPFSEDLVRPFVLSFCPPGGMVLDCFGGSGTTAAVCELEGRKSISIDVRESQVELIRRRIEEAQARREKKAANLPDEQPQLFPEPLAPVQG